MTSFKPNNTNSIDNLNKIIKEFDNSKKDYDNKIEELQNLILSFNNQLENSIFFDITDIEPVIDKSIASFDKYTYTITGEQADGQSNTLSDNMLNITQYMTLLINLTNIKYDENAEFTPLPSILYVKNGNDIYNLYIQSWRKEENETETNYVLTFNSNELMQLNFWKYNLWQQHSFTYTIDYDLENAVSNYTFSLEIHKPKSNH